MDKGAVLSACGAYRYRLWRWWDHDKPALAFIMLNPSTADAGQDDPTIRRCIGFAERLGYGGIEVANLFAFRATKPADLFKAVAPVGPLNDGTLRGLAETVINADGRVVCAWGSNAKGNPRVGAVLNLLAGLYYAGLLYALRVNNDGTPAHPLMLPYSCDLQEFAP